MSWRNLLSATICFTSCSILNAATFNVTDGSSLQSAISMSNNGTSPNTINFSNTINLATTGTPLPAPILYPLNSSTSFGALNSYSLTINGASNTLNGNSALRGFFVLGGTVAISNLTFMNTLAQGGAGGSASTIAGAGGGAPVSVGVYISVMEQQSP